MSVSYRFNSENPDTLIYFYIIREARLIFQTGKHPHIMILRLYLYKKLFHYQTLFIPIAGVDRALPTVMPSAHGPIFYRRQKIGVKISSCALTFAPILNRSDLFSELLTTKNRSVCADFSPIKNRSHPTMRPRLLLSHTIVPIKSRSVCADFWSEKKIGPIFSRSCLRQKIGRVR